MFLGISYWLGVGIATLITGVVCALLYFQFEKEKKIYDKDNGKGKFDDKYGEGFIVMCILMLISIFGSGLTVLLYIGILIAFIVKKYIITEDEETPN